MDRSPELAGGHVLTDGRRDKGHGVHPCVGVLLSHEEERRSQTRCTGINPEVLKINAIRQTPTHQGCIGNAWDRFVETESRTVGTSS